MEIGRVERVAAVRPPGFAGVARKANAPYRATGIHPDTGEPPEAETASWRLEPHVRPPDPERIEAAVVVTAACAAVLTGAGAPPPGP